MKFVYQYLKAYKIESILAPLFKMLEAIFELFVPLVVAAIIDVGITTNDTDYILRRCGLLLLLATIGLAVAITAQFFAAKAAICSASKMREDLFFHIHSGQKFSNQKTKFYVVEILLAVEFLHKNNMIYRDLKPENILIDAKGHIKLTDFGLSKTIELNMDNKAYTICGTLQYLAPEIIKGEGYNESVDWWSLGIIMFEMLTGRLPFKFKLDGQPDLNIYKKKIVFPSWMEENAKDSIINLLNIDPEKRIGNGINGAENIKKHPFFNDIDWDKALNKELKPPFVPKLDDEIDIKYFEKSLDESPIFSDSSELILNVEENEEVDEDDYDGFTFVATSYKELKDMENEKE